VEHVASRTDDVTDVKFDDEAASESFSRFFTFFLCRRLIRFSEGVEADVTDGIFIESREGNVFLPKKAAKKPVIKPNKSSLGVQGCQDC
jgi:hypothetical protein